jgi:hypothetical protein
MNELSWHLTSSKWEGFFFPTRWTPRWLKLKISRLFIHFIQWPTNVKQMHACSQTPSKPKPSSLFLHKSTISTNLASSQLTASVWLLLCDSDMCRHSKLDSWIIWRRSFNCTLEGSAASNEKLRNLWNVVTTTWNVLKCGWKVSENILNK